MAKKPRKKDVKRSLPVEDYKTPKRFNKKGQLKSGFRTVGVQGSGRVPTKTVAKSPTSKAMSVTLGSSKKDKGTTIYTRGKKK